MASTKKTSKKAKVNKKKKSGFVFILFIAVIVIVGIVGWVNKGDVLYYFTRHNSLENSQTNEESAIKVEGITFDNFQVHFLELGVYETGDSVFIKAGSTDILIDAGATASSVPTIINYVNNYCKDGKLEYVITTHAHTDHYAGMFGKDEASTNYKGEKIERNGIMYYYDIDTIIDFAQTAKTDAQLSNPGSEINSYYAAVDYAVSKGATHYTAEECLMKKIMPKNHTH